MKIDMAMVFKFGQMAQSMKVNGLVTKQKERELSGMLKATCMMEISKMTKRMDMECTPTLMVHAMKGNGEKTCKKDTAKSYGAMVLVMLEATEREKSMAMEFITGSTKVDMKATGMKIR